VRFQLLDGRPAAEHDYKDFPVAATAAVMMNEGLTASL